MNTTDVIALDAARASRSAADDCSAPWRSLFKAIRSSTPDIPFVCL